MSTTAATVTTPGMTFPLTPKPGAVPVRAPAAWFIPGADPAAWLDEVARWDVPMDRLRLHVLPTSLADRRPAGVLVTLPPGAAPARPLRALAYGQIAGRLFLPVEARLEPPVSEAELRAALPLPLYVLHPAVGLVGFAQDDALRVADLLAGPPARAARWDRAVAGPPPAPRLLSIEPEQVPDVSVMLSEGRGDIGSEAPDGLPPGADESALKDLLSKAGKPGLKALKWLSEHVPGAPKPPPGKASDPRWTNRLQKWATEKLAAIDAARQRELKRLQEMLERDPDLGLRFAIPLHGSGGRGRANPATALPPRNVNFNLSSLGGGSGPADVWDVPYEVRQALTDRYRALANRELNLGRYRRAAYILGELLGDYPAAASALEQGRHFREAAAVYREYLRSPAKAAVCLERGGLLLEAVTIYEHELGAYEKAGDLYARIDRPDDAVRCWRAQADRYKETANFLSAAKLLEGKLAAPEEALDVLTNADPSHDSSGACLQESFALLGRMARHDETARRLGRLRQDAPPAAAGRAGVLAQVLSAVAATYPEPAARVLAADATRVVAGRTLPRAAESEKEVLIRAVTRLAPEDRLLTRDGSRYIQRTKPARRRGSGRRRCCGRPRPRARGRWSCDSSVCRSCRAGMRRRHTARISSWRGTRRKDCLSSAGGGTGGPKARSGAPRSSHRRGGSWGRRPTGPTSRSCRWRRARPRHGCYWRRPARSARPYRSAHPNSSAAKDTSRSATTTRDWPGSYRRTWRASRRRSARSAKSRATSSPATR